MTPTRAVAALTGTLAVVLLAVVLLQGVVTVSFNPPRLPAAPERRPPDLSHEPGYDAWVAYVNCLDGADRLRYPSALCVEDPGPTPDDRTLELSRCLNVECVREVLTWYPIERSKSERT